MQALEYWCYNLNRELVSEQIFYENPAVLDFKIAEEF